ncbi:MAG: FliM/FliN family flagellar motor C-terminal domain-containing protein [Sphingorhabdus sp.]
MGAQAFETIDLVTATAQPTTAEPDGVETAPLRDGIELLLERYGFSGADTRLADDMRETQTADGDSLLLSAVDSSGSVCALMLFPKALFDRLFERAYGGGRDVASWSPLSKAQRQFAERLCQRFCDWSNAACAEATVGPLSKGAASFTDPANSFHAFKAAKKLTFITSSNDNKPYIIEAALGREMTPRSRNGLHLRRSRHDRIMQMATATCPIPLSVRSEIAIGTMPASRLFAIRPGDVIPIALPHSVPVLAEGTIIASASIGECDGKAALRIDSLNERQTL